jgi:transcription factor SFP1
MMHGFCNFAPPKDLEALQALLLAEKGVVVDGNDRSEVQITEGKLYEVERGAECLLAALYLKDVHLQQSLNL